MNRKAYFIFNPYAGKGLIRNHLLDIIDTLTKAGYEVTTYPTQCPKDAIQAAKEKASECDILVCCGGDGTLDEVVTGMMQSGVNRPIGYIPAGSTNDFANSLCLPCNMKEAARVICDGEEFACDIGTFNDDVFVYVAAFGLFTEVSYETPQEVKNVLGHSAYIIEGMKQLSNIKSHSLRVTYGDQVIEDEFVFGMISNSSSIGGFKKLTGKHVELSDGLFEVTLIKMPRNPLEFNSIVSALLIEDINTEFMYCFKTDSLTLESLNGEEVAWTLDGEFGGNHVKTQIKNHKGLLKIIVDKEADIK